MRQEPASPIAVLATLLFTVIIVAGALYYGTHPFREANQVPSADLSPQVTAANTQQLSSVPSDEGGKIFHQICVACHTINKGKLIGPDLANVHTRRPMEWIIPFVRSSQAVIKSGDSYAAALFEEFNKLLMPDNNLTDDQILAVISYIAANSPGGSPGLTAETDTSLPVVEDPVPTQENVQSGKLLFVGQMRLAAGGPACISCHNIKHEGIIAGGTLSKDLTDAHSRLSGAGVKAIMGSPPFPAMKQAFDGKPLTEAEIFDLTAFLQDVDSTSASQQDRQYAGALLLSGVGGLVLFIGLFFGVRVRSKKESVNHAIYVRQVKSTWEDMGY